MVQVGIIGEDAGNAPGCQLPDSAGIIDGEDVDDDAGGGKGLDEDGIDKVILGMIGNYANGLEIIG